MLSGVGDGFLEWSQLLGGVLRHDPERRWKLRVLDAVALQLRVLESGERLGLRFGFKKSSLPFPGLAVVDHELEMQTIVVGVSANLDFALSHALPLPDGCRENK